MINLTLSFSSVAEMHAELASLVAILPPAPATTAAPIAIVQRAERIAAETLPPAAEQEAPKAPKPPRQAKPAAVPEVKAESPAATPTASETAIAATTAPAEPEAASVSPSEPEALTLEAVRAKLAAISQAGKQPQVKALIAELGVTKLTDIPADKYAELIEKADAL